MQLNWRSRWRPWALFTAFLPSAPAAVPFVSGAVCVAESTIHGRGLFASRAIRKGEILGQCTTLPTTESGDYTLSLDDGCEVDVVCDLKYINHSKQPNAAYYDDLTVVALRNISPGEEITHNYGDDWD